MTEERVYASRSILVVGAHAFDAEVMAGPLAAVAVDRGATVTFLHLSLGEQGHTRLAPADYARQKREEAEAAAATLGVGWRSFDLRDGFVSADDETALRVCDVIRALRPETIITHWHGSWHKDHRAAATAVGSGAFFAGLPTLRRTDPAFNPALLLFAENWEDDADFSPRELIDVTAGFDRWREAALKYELARDLGSFPYVDYYAALYRLRGCLRGTTYAQAFSKASASWQAGMGIFTDTTTPRSRP